MQKPDVERFNIPTRHVASVSSGQPNWTTGAVAHPNMQIKAGIFFRGMRATEPRIRLLWECNLKKGEMDTYVCVRINKNVCVTCVESVTKTAML